MMKVKFKPGVTSPAVKIVNGNYRRVFEQAAQPFEVSEEEWTVLEPKGLFEQADGAAVTEEKKEPEKPADAPDQGNEHGAADQGAPDQTAADADGAAEAAQPAAAVNKKARK
jgi:hypothetical protein